MTKLAKPFDPAGASLSVNFSAAFALARAGFNIFPCDPSGGKDAFKRPILVRSWASESTDDLFRITQWWTQRPDALVGIDLAKAGLVVIDPDRHGGPDGVAAFDALVAQHGLPEGVPVVDTQAGGKHFFFSHPEGVTLQNRSGALPAGIDVKCAGGYVIAVGSRLQDGRCWRMADGSPNLLKTFESGATPILPTWLVDLIQGPRPGREPAPSTVAPSAPRVRSGTREEAYALAALERECAEVAATDEGGRNNRLNQAAFLLGTLVGAGRLSRPDCAAALWDAAEACGEAAEAPRKTRDTINRGLADGAQKPRAPLEREQSAIFHDPKRRGARADAEAVEDKSPPPVFRDDLLVSAWRQRELPPRDYLSGEVLCTTSRVLLIGPTGIGKTLFVLDWAAAIAAGAPFLGWAGRRRARVMYLDGELPAETFKERMEMIGDRYGDDIELFGYNRDVLGPDEMPPLNTPAGRAWLWREIEIVKPDLIGFDAIMSLLIGNMSEEESWAPIKDLVRKISAMRIAQIWLHHTGHDASKGFGTKTREWEMDCVVMLSKLESEDDEPNPSAAFRLKFEKSRHKKPSNYKQFADKIIRATDTGFICEDGGPAKPKAKGEFAAIIKAFPAAYDRLADGVEPSPGFDGKPVRKVKADDIRDELKRRGYLEVDKKGGVTTTSRSHFRRAKLELLNGKRFVENEGMLWKI